MLFENPEKKMYIPVEAATVISVYSDIVLSSGFVKFAADHRLKLKFYDKHGEYVGSFCPSCQRLSIKTTIAQSLLYSNAQKRLKLAKKIIIASTQNIKSNIQYYNRRYDNIDLSDTVKVLLEGDKYTPFKCGWCVTFLCEHALNSTKYVSKEQIGIIPLYEHII